MLSIQKWTFLHQNFVSALRISAKVISVSSTGRHRMQMSMCRISVITLTSFCFEEFGVLQLPTLSPTQGKVDPSLV